VYVSASAGRRTSDHGAGAGSQVSADVGQSARKVGSIDAMLSATRGSTGWPSSA
jgi:hypothetical protein